MSATNSTLRRFITTITGPNSHPDRELIKPTVEEVKDLHAANRPFSWTVSVSLLDRAFKVTEQKASQSAGESSSNENGMNSSANNELLRQAIDMLKTELEEKNKQIANYQERQRENSVLIKSAHEQLTKLASGSASDSKPSTAAETVEATAAKEGSDPKGTTASNGTRLHRMHS